MKVGGGTGPARSTGKKLYFARAPPLFGSKNTISRLGECFRDGQYSSVSFLFAVLLLTVPPPPSCSAIVKVCGTCSPCPMERRHWLYGACMCVFFLSLFTAVIL